MTPLLLKPHHRNRSGVIFIKWLMLIATVIGLLLAYYLGKTAGQGDYTKIIAFGAVISGLCICLALKTKIWLLIPATWFLGGTVGGLHLPFGLNQLAVIGVFGMFMVFYALKIPIRKASYGTLDYILFINLAYLLITFVRNPIGVAAINSDMVGGRPYFDVGISFLAYWIFVHVLLDLKAMRYFPKLLCAGSLVTAILGVVTRYIPGTATIIAPIYSGVNTQSYIEQNFGGTDAVVSDMYRLNELNNLGAIVNLYLCSMFRPLTLLTPARVLQWVTFILAWIGIFLGGFRSSIIQNGLYFVLSSYFYSGSKDVVRSLFFAFAAASLLIACQGMAFDLPLPAQRALSFLPGHWNSMVVDDASASTDWRLEMWSTVWKSSEYLQDRYFGQGFGFKASDLTIQVDALLGGAGYIDGSGAQTQMITGAFHNGPLSTIRVVGILGLILYTWLMIYSAIFSWRLIRRAKGTAFFGLALFVGLPLIYKPFDFYIIFGGFDGSLPYSIFQAGLLRLVETSLGASSPIAIAEPKSESSILRRKHAFAHAGNQNISTRATSN